MKDATEVKEKNHIGKMELNNSTQKTQIISSGASTKIALGRKKYQEILKENGGFNFRRICASFSLNFADWNSYASQKEVSKSWIEAMARFSQKLVVSLLDDIQNSKVWDSHFSPRLRDFLKLCEEKQTAMQEEGVKNPFVDELGFYEDDDPEKVLWEWSRHLFYLLEPELPTWWMLVHEQGYAFREKYPSEMFYKAEQIRKLSEKGLAWIKQKVAEVKNNQDIGRKDYSKNLQELISGINIGSEIQVQRREEKVAQNEFKEVLDNIEKKHFEYEQTESAKEREAKNKEKLKQLMAERGYAINEKQFRAPGELKQQLYN